MVGFGGGGGVLSFADSFLHGRGGGGGAVSSRVPNRIQGFIATVLAGRIR